MLIWRSFLFAFSMLLPLVNPLGSALIFADLIGPQPPAEYRLLGRRIALASFLFLIACEYLGGIALTFFGLTLPVVQAAGGAVLAATGWRLLFQPDAATETAAVQSQVDAVAEDAALRAKVFYPFTFPVTTGPGCMVAMLTLSARAALQAGNGRALVHAGTVLAAAVLCASVALAYGYAPRLITTVSPGTAHGILRLVSFLLLCIGVQIAWHGLAGLHA